MSTHTQTQTGLMIMEGQEGAMWTTLETRVKSRLERRNRTVVKVDCVVVLMSEKGMSKFP